jgi:hypothetical protein
MTRVLGRTIINWSVIGTVLAPYLILLEEFFMKKFLLAITILMSASYAQAAVYEEYVARCVEIGKELFHSRVYALHVNETKDKGILVAVDTDLLTDVVYGDIVFKGTRKTGITISMPAGKAEFKSMLHDPGGYAVIKGVKYGCDYAQ